MTIMTFLLSYKLDTSMICLLDQVDCVLQISEL